MVLIGNIFGFLGSLLGSVVQSSSAAKRQREANAANMELAKYQNEQNFLQWQRENEYNNPVNQLNRLKQAGINPALINGSTVDAGTASPLRYTRASVNPLPGINLGLDHMAQLELVGSQIQLNKAKARKENASAGNDEWQLQFNQVTEQLQRDFMELKNDNSKANTEKVRASIRQVDEQLAQNHIKIGIYANLSAEQMYSIAQAREYQRKEFDLKQWQVGQQIKIAWQNADTSRLSAESMALRNACLNEMTAEQVGLLHEQTTNAIIEGEGKIQQNVGQAIDNYWAARGIKLGAGLSAMAGMAVTSLDAAVNMKVNAGGLLSGATEAYERYRKRAAQSTKKRK